MFRFEVLPKGSSSLLRFFGCTRISQSACNGVLVAGIESKAHERHVYMRPKLVWVLELAVSG